MNLSLKNLLVLLVCSGTLVLAGCKKSSSTNYDISVNTTGLIGSSVVVQLNSTYNLTIPSDGTSTFTTQLSSGTVYDVVITKQPSLPPQTCVLANANGTITGNVSNVTLTCSPIEFAYLTNSNANSIMQLVIDQSTGALSQNSGPVATGNDPVAFAISQNGRYAFVVNQADNTISAYLANTTLGLLVNAGNAIETNATLNGTPTAVAVDPLSQFVYVVNSGTSTVTGYSINATTGVLTCLGGSITACPSAPTATTGTAPSALTFATQNGAEYLYVVNSGSGNISEYLMSSTGALTPNGTAGAGNNPKAIAVTAVGGPFVFVVNESDATVSAYVVNAGVLGVNGSATSTGGLSPTSIAITPNGRFAYVTNSNSTTNSIAEYSISSSGILSYLGAVSTTISPDSITVEPTGQFAYVTSTTNNVTTYQIGSNGILSALATQQLGNGPVSLVTAAN